MPKKLIIIQKNTQNDPVISIKLMLFCFIKFELNFSSIRLMFLTVSSLLFLNFVPCTRILGIGHSIIESKEADYFHMETVTASLAFARRNSKGNRNPLRIVLT